jgi:hypothetical protein
MLRTQSIEALSRRGIALRPVRLDYSKYKNLKLRKEKKRGEQAARGRFYISFAGHVSLTDRRSSGAIRSPYSSSVAVAIACISVRNKVGIPTAICNADAINPNVHLSPQAILRLEWSRGGLLGPLINQKL